MSGENCNAALEAGFEAIRRAREYGQPALEEGVRRIMMAVYMTDLLMSARLGSPPSNPMLDPRWNG